MELVGAIIALVAAVFAYWVRQRQRKTEAQELHEAITDEIKRDQRATTTDGRALRSYNRRKRIKQLLKETDGHLPTSKRKTT